MVSINFDHKIYYVKRESYHKALQRFIEANKGKRNAEIIAEYLIHKESQNLSVYRLSRLLSVMKKIAELADFEFDRMEQKDLEKHVVAILSRNWKEWTKVTYLKILKNFVRWLNKRYGLSVDVSEIRARKPKNSILPEYLITKEEFERLFNATDDLQMRVILGLLYESGARIGEILGLKIKHVRFEGDMAVLTVQGKTGQRTIPIVWYAGLLRQFFEFHPLKDYPDAPLFYTKSKDGEIVSLKYNAFRRRLKRLCKKAGINKRIYPHLFRHTRLTELTKHVPEEILKRFAGWAADSRMPKVYLHTSMRYVREVLLERVYGMEVRKKPSEENGVVRCPRCGEINPKHAVLCFRCRTPLNTAVYSELVYLKELDDWAGVLLEFFKRMEKKYPEVWKEMAEIVVERGLERLVLGHR